MPQIRNAGDVFKKYSAFKELEAGDDDLGPWVEVNASAKTTSHAQHTTQRPQRSEDTQNEEQFLYSDDSNTSSPGVDQSIPRARFRPGSGPASDKNARNLGNSGATSAPPGLRHNPRKRLASGEVYPGVDAGTALAGRPLLGQRNAFGLSQAVEKEQQSSTFVSGPTTYATSNKHRNITDDKVSKSYQVNREGELNTNGWTANEDEDGGNSRFRGSNSNNQRPSPDRQQESEMSPDAVRSAGSGAPVIMDMACLTCRKKKKGCTKEKPCASCLKSKDPCEYPSAASRLSPSRIPSHVDKASAGSSKAINGSSRTSAQHQNQNITAEAQPRKSDGRFSSHFESTANDQTITNRSVPNPPVSNVKPGSYDVHYIVVAPHDQYLLNGNPLEDSTLGEFFGHVSTYVPGAEISRINFQLISFEEVFNPLTASLGRDDVDGFESKKKVIRLKMEQGSRNKDSLNFELRITPVLAG